MGNTQERIKKRQEYLKRKTTLILLLTYMSFIVCCWIAYPFLPKGHIRGILSLLLGVTWLATFFTGITFVQVKKRLKQLPYIPPVTADTLPAEEVLVRGSEEPKQSQSQVLLRNTDGSTGTANQELLRSSQRQK